MTKWTKTAGLLFMAAASVYADRAIAAKPGKPAVSKAQAVPTDVKLLEETDPFAAPAPTTAPTSQPAGDSAPKASAAAAQPNSDGTFSLNITAGADIVEQLRVIGFQAQTSIIPSKEVHGALPATRLHETGPVQPVVAKNAAPLSPTWMLGVVLAGVMTHEPDGAGSEELTGFGATGVQPDSVGMAIGVVVSDTTTVQSADTNPDLLMVKLP